MDTPKVTVYVASSVGIDYFYFLLKTIMAAGYPVQEVSLISEQSYRRLARVSGVKKLWLRTKMYVIYPLYLLFVGLACRKNSIFIVSSNTFYAPFIVHNVLRFRGVRVVHMLYDLYPDALEIAGGLHSNSMPSRTLGLIANANQKGCDGTVYLGQFLKQHAEGRWGRAAHSEVIDISTDISLYDPFYPEPTDYNPLIIHYGGQLGHLHDCQSIIECVRRICESPLSTRIKFVFYVSGAQAELLRRSLKSYPVEIVSTTPSSQWRLDIREFHIGLVSLTPAGASVCLPSKTYAMMAGGLAIIAICPSWSDLAALVRSVDGGWIISNSPHQHMASPVLKKDYDSYLSDMKRSRSTDDICNDFCLTIERILDAPEMLKEKRKNAFYGVRKQYGIDQLQRKWDRFLKSMTAA